MKFQKTFNGVLTQSPEEFALDQLLQTDDRIFSTIPRFNATRRKLQAIIIRGEGLQNLTLTSFSKIKKRMKYICLFFITWNIFLIR